MKKSILVLNAIATLMVLNIGASAFADTVKQPDPNKIEKKFDKNDLQFYRQLKAKTQKDKTAQTKRKHKLDHEVAKRKGNQMDDQTRLVHLKERLNLVAGDDAATKKLRAKIAKTEQRIRERAGRIDNSLAKQKFVGDKLAATDQRLTSIQSAIDAKKNEIALDNQAIADESSGSL
jgi:small-conductance mechanosensitive channel